MSSIHATRLAIHTALSVVDASVRALNNNNANNNTRNHGWAGV